ncbi:hypothetical protein VTN96DRAFT_248 [Rasamsonia emersonii]|uniref:Uncharacterized protein n=1 Tax=Rasamsonia emersonii (strain ATCC 16479 / CBS 393.64 / IMI 116815) TaxID=1408163 RepID=A0A0F4YRC8_RASE3|nr:hypothetical protein T310_5167 [Rasamsonia emersonii CBS 393.64]KKA20804.1 hypothetical protein T310_5167 [Rasamsonia emersonii CBS 393.64]
MHTFDIIDSDSEFESDVSYDRPRRPTIVRRRSFSRRRRSSPDSNSYLSPDVIQTVHRSASTGGRRRRDPTVVINNDIRTRQMHKERRGRPLYNEVDEYDEIDILRRGRPRAGSSLSRTSSPHHRDWELLMDQRLLERNDRRQDIELMKHRQELERLERQFARRHEHAREPRFEDWEDELIERLRKLDRLERSKRAEDDRLLAEYREKVKKLEEMERKAAEEEEARRLAREKYLKELEKKEALRAEKERIKKELRDEEARRLLEEEERKKELAKIKAAAVEEYKRAEEAKKLREIEEKERKDKEFKARLKEEFGCSEEQLEALIKKQKEKDKDKEREREREKPHSPPEPTTYIKVHRKYLLPETLIAYRLPWDWDEHDSNYIIIKTWISEDFQEELFAHTRRLREGKLVSETSSSLTELKVNDRKKDKMYLVRKKSPRRAWIFT